MGSSESVGHRLSLPTRSLPKPPTLCRLTGRNWTLARGVRSIPHVGAPRSGDCGPSTANPQAREDGRETTDDALWLALCAAPAEGAEVSELMRVTGWKRTKLYRHLREYAQAGRAVQVSRGRWRVDSRRAVTVSDRPAGRPIPPPRTRVCT